MFENLTVRLNQVFDQLRRRGKLSEVDVDAAVGGGRRLAPASGQDGGGGGAGSEDESAARDWLAHE